ncbi:MAG: transglutaminase domain-containing protein [Verrucomicrobiales bacterium]|nr:transglutaminase domain-containing protein [Verrucomicrobiales bacterium]
MKTPPFLLLATLVFWGWQSGFLLAGAIMGVVLESARLVKVRWDLTEEDFRRIWNFCVLLALALVVYAFAANEEGGGLSGLLQSSAAAATRNAGLSATAFLRWLPMTLFLFIAAQLFSERGAVPLSAISFFARRRKGSGTAERHVNVSYPYFIVCLFSAGIHANQGTHTYFFGQAILIVWALWSLRSRRFGIVAWLCALAVVMGIAYAGHLGVNQVRQMLEGYNAQWIARFMRQRTDAALSVTSMGQIGSLKLSPRIVIRLEPKNGGAPPEYLREASYRSYRSLKQTWHVGDSRDEFTDLLAETNGTTWVLLPGKTNSSVVNIACYLNGWSRDLDAPDGLLPLPAGSGRLEKLPVFTLKTSKNGAVLAGGPGLVIFDARYGPGATIDSPPASTNFDLDVPTNEVPALDLVVSEMDISGANTRQKLRAVQNFFAGKFTYSTWQGPDKAARTNETVLGRFLLNSRSGHCEYFATATVLLLRQLNIPARYAVGYVVHEKSGRGYVVRERDAHAWCLAWDDQAKAWVDFDTTPGSWVAEEGKRASPLEWLSDARSWLGFQFAKFRWGQTNLRQYVLWALVPVLALLLYQIIFRRGRRRRMRPKTGISAAAIFWPGLDSEFYLLERRLAALGVPRQPSEPLSDWLARALADPALAGLRTPLQELLRLHYRHRFDPAGLSNEERETLARETKTCLDSLSMAAGFLRADRA